MTNEQVALLHAARSPKRHAHRFDATWSEALQEWVRSACDFCGLSLADYEARRKRGRTALRAGKDAERAIAKTYGGRRTGHFGGPDDVVVGEVLCIQSKAGVGWFSERMWKELQKLPRTGGRIPTLVISDRPGPGHKRRSLSIRLTEDDVALLGTEANPARGSVLDEGTED